MAFQSITPVKLGQAAITASLVTLYTVPASTRTFVKDFDICNTTVGALTVRVHLIPGGGSASAANAILYDISIPANSTLQWSGSQVMYATDFIQTVASNTGLTITASGGEAV
jgi:hypothetical protein